LYAYIFSILRTQVAYTKVAVALFLAFLPASFAATGDTWTADLTGSTLPPGSSFVKVCFLPLSARFFRPRFTFFKILPSSFTN
jgi:hypothetical protein